jgi:ATP-dependent DNA helicase DinG
VTGFVSLHCAPVRIAPILKEQLYDKKECMIFSSATLTVGGDFGFFKSRLGLDLLPEGGVSYADVGSPFDYEKQAFVTVADFLPEPTREEDGGYAKELSGFLGPLFTATQGRAMALFTSYRLLDAVYNGLKDAMEREGILVLCQGRSGSRASITRAFQSGEKSVLLGTSSFWEGVDIAGDSLRCLVITRLPFQVFTDPVFQARYEDVEKRGEDAFVAFSVPNAVIRFRQGFGRLIRSKRDSGVVVIADKRIVTKRYGGKFAKSLPAPCKKYTRKDELIDAVRLFLARP